MAFPFRRKRQALQGRYTPNLWPVWIVAPLALIAASALGWVIYHYAYDHFTQAAADQTPPKPVNTNDVLKATVTALTLIGAVLAGLYAYRKQLLAEGDAHRADASQLADRYTTAAEQLGHEQAAVRLAGVYALARLADDWAEQRQVCIDVLCAYLRMPYEPDPTTSEHKAGEREVRQTIIRVIRDHLQTPDAATAWCRQSFNFTGAIFDGGDFSTSHFQNKVSFGGATFSSGMISFNDSTFSSGEVYFNDATFNGGTVDFGNATFNGGTVYFNDATFNGGKVYFNDATFSSGTVDLTGATFRGGTVDLSYATFNGGTVDLIDATFNGGKVYFNYATFSSGEVYFNDATFSSGEVYFNLATFNGGTVDFSLATFNGGEVYFNDATFSSGTVDFGNATFSSGTVLFNGATFTGTVFEWGALPVPAGA